MAENPVPDDSSHYEISLTAGQAFIAFILLLCSLGAAFAFGILVGRGQLDERLIVRRDPAVIEEGTAADAGRVVELQPDREPDSSPLGSSETIEQPVIIDDFVPPAEPDQSSAAPPVIETKPPAKEPARPAAVAPGPVLAQVLSSSEARPAENLAARLIEAGFTSAYVERVQTARGMIYRVRVPFQSEADARAASNRLETLGGGEVWITRP